MRSLFGVHLLLLLLALYCGDCLLKMRMSSSYVSSSLNLNLSSLVPDLVDCKAVFLSRGLVARCNSGRNSDAPLTKFYLYRKTNNVARKKLLLDKHVVNMNQNNQLRNVTCQCVECRNIDVFILQLATIGQLRTSLNISAWCYHVFGGILSLTFLRHI